MHKIFSKIEGKEEVLLHQINRIEDIELQTERRDLSPTNEFLQVATLKLKQNQTFKPHHHIYKKCEPETIAQETWLIIRGMVKVIYYDLDNKIIDQYVLFAGDCTITYRGGHNYIALEEGTIVYEVKSSQYEGQEKDKKFIE